MKRMPMVLMCSIVCFFGVMLVRKTSQSPRSEKNGAASISPVFIVNEAGHRINLVFSTSIARMPQNHPFGISGGTKACLKPMADRIMNVQTVYAQSCTLGNCYGAFYYNDPVECCPGGGGMARHYVGGGTDPNQGWKYSGTESCTNGGCPSRCTEEGCTP